MTDGELRTSAIETHPAVIRVRAALLAARLQGRITAVPKAAHTARQAADALGIPVAAIAKSIIFAAADGRAVLAITSGANRVDRVKVAAAIGQAVAKADADFVREKTGFVIGGVAPIAHLAPPIALMDRDLLSFDHVWPAAGHPNTMFRIAPADLARIAGATVCDVAEESIPCIRTKS